MQILAQQNHVAEHAVALKAPLPHSQSKMTVEDVKHRARLYFEIGPQTVPRLACVPVAQVVPFALQDAQGAECGQTE